MYKYKSRRKKIKEFNIKTDDLLSKLNNELSVEDCKKVIEDWEKNIPSKLTLSFVNLLPLGVFETKLGKDKKAKFVLLFLGLYEVSSKILPKDSLGVTFFVDALIYILFLNTWYNFFMFNTYIAEYKYISLVESYNAYLKNQENSLKENGENLNENPL